ncbi:nucleoporin NUP42 isoform X1 [Alligator mississippiensis]|uniref:nucleoporin NUP42 isoform X1 n=1 Tax=Alligator mississippiensis TaxID=8496 RepID=UPI0009075E5F|nr:nucleoporin NUP42 isoform X1 [Alligator mississippiensis]
MTVCQYFLQGRCRFGEHCWNEHPRGGGRPGSTASSYPVRWGARAAAVLQPSGYFGALAWGGREPARPPFAPPSGFGASGSGGGGRSSQLSQNRFSALSAGDAGREDEEKLLEGIIKDMEIWESSGQWMFSCYAPMKEKPNISGFPDFSPEELHLEYYNCRANSNVQNYINSVQQFINQWRNRLLELKTLNASTKSALLSELKNVVSAPLPSFGFGGQQTSSFGSSNFTIQSSSISSPNNFSFKSNSVSASSGSTPAIGSPSTVQGPSAFGVTSSSSTPHSVAFGSQPTISAASFSFRNPPETTGGFGTSGFSGFGSSSTVNSSSTTSVPSFGSVNTAVAARTSDTGNTLFGQSFSAFGHSVTSAPSVITSSSTSEKLFTSKTDLSAEELKQFEAKKFTLGKIPLKPPPTELLTV